MFNILSRPRVESSSIPPWLAEARRRAPAVRALVEWAREAWSRVADPRCSPWTTAAALSGLIESVPIVVTGPPVVIVRLVIIFGFLSQCAGVRGAQPDQDQRWWRRRRRRRSRYVPHKDSWSWWF